MGMKKGRAALTAVALAAMACCVGCGRTAIPSTGFQHVGSSQIFSVKYYPETRTLTVIAVGGEGYDYAEVPQEVYDGLLAAEAKDEYFDTQIKGKYEATQF